MRRKFYLNKIDVVKWYEQLFQRDPISLTFSLTVILAIVLAIASTNIYLNKWEEFVVQMVAEAHGILFDILVLGILFVWIDRISKRKQAIDQCLEDIEDLRLRAADIMEFNSLEEQSKGKPSGPQPLEELSNYRYALRASTLWNSEYVRLKTIKSIKLLVRNKMHMLDLHNINISGGKFHSINLRKSKLNASLLVDCILTHGNFSLTHCQDTNFNGSNLDFGDFENAKAIGASFCDASLNYTKFAGASLVAAHFERAYLTHTKLNNCALAGADFTDAHLLEVDFRNCPELTAQQILKAKFYSKCKFDPHLEKTLAFQKALVNTKPVAVSSDQPALPMKVQIAG